MTPAQAAVIAKPAPLAWAVVAGDGFVAVFCDQAQALRYATHVSDGVVVPLVPQARVSHSTES